MKKEIITFKNPKSPISEVFKTLRTNIQFMNVNKKMQVLLLTSTFPGEGKSWITSNLAVTFAQAGKRVIIVDSDMRKGRQYAIFGLSPKPGLSNYLSEVEVDEDGRASQSVEVYIQETEVENLHVITAGSIPPNPSELLVSAQMLQMIEELRRLYDIIIIDGTPSELVTDAVILSRIVDSTIIVTAHKITKKDALARVVKNIKNVGGKIAGVVINKVPVNAKKYGERYYYYGEDRRMSRKQNKAKDSKVKEQEEKIKKIYNDEIKIKKKSEQDDVRKKNSNLEKMPKVKEIEEMVRSSESSKTSTMQEMARIERESKFKEKSISTEEKDDILKQINDYLDQEKKNK